MEPTEVNIVNPDIDAEGWELPPDGGTCPVNDQKLLDNLRINARWELPELRPVRAHDDTLLFVAGGPSAASYIEEIRERSKEPDIKVMTCNDLHGWLMDQGIVPWALLLLDPGEHIGEYVAEPHDDITYFVGAHIDPGVFIALEGQKIVKCYFGSTTADHRIEHDLIAELSLMPPTILPGGTMTPLRAMVLAQTIGFQKMEFYGLDSCYKVDGTEYVTR